MNQLLKSLNPVQQAIVQAEAGPVLVLAGAGSGKTRVLTHRIAYLLTQKKFKSHEILAVTFTNKAAQEMKRRIQKLVQKDFGNLWVGTFHSIFARILRAEAPYLGYSRNFVIYDVDDQKKAIKNLMTDHHISLKDFSVADVHRRISRLKNQMIDPDEFQDQIKTDEDEVVALIYRHYSGFLRANNAMDFDDLIKLPVELFHTYPKVLQKYQERFKYLLVDEYQDTNLAQNRLVLDLGSRSRNVFVVGDDDQSIYRWRGAEIRNILEFEDQFPDCQIFRLEQNYRSTRTIVDAAYSVVKNNILRKQKRLWTERENGDKITLLIADDENVEARLIVDAIRTEIVRNKRNFKDFVILYRTNAQSRAIEDALRRNTITYDIVGGFRFYERKEIKDFLAYLRVIANPNDSISLERIINFPRRSIGTTTLLRLKQFAAEHKISLLEALGRAREVSSISKPMQTRVLDVYQLFQNYIELKDKLSIGELASVLEKEVGFKETYREEGTEEALNRYDNIIELLSAITEFSKTRENPSLDAFLEDVALVSDIDNWNDSSNAVTLMTVHSAKGLEFPVVFISGLEEGLFPLFRSFDSIEELEEERRLFYVAVTRAKDKVYLSWARNRRQFIRNNGQVKTMSQFVKQIPADLLEIYDA
ncbi:MAG: UvrD-helicase domain-containing protein, partial [Calditrichaeota bacterium]|nr:UvrD-helicase domain-containing protein [Calditrichota bacterium]